LYPAPSRKAIASQIVSTEGNFSPANSLAIKNWLNIGKISNLITSYMKNSLWVGESTQKGILLFQLNHQQIFE